MPSPSSHLAPAPDPPHLPPLDVPAAAGDGRKERSKSPQKAELFGPELLGPGRRAAASGGSGRAKREGGRSTHKGHRVQPTTEGDGGKDGEPKASRSNRGRSKERAGGDAREAAHSPSSSRLPHTNGNSREDAESYGGVQGEADRRPREPDRGPGESRPGLPGKSGGSAVAGRKATVSPGPWKIPGSDKLPSSLRSGASTLSR